MVLIAIQTYGDFFIINKNSLNFSCDFHLTFSLLKASYPYCTTSVGGSKWRQHDELCRGPAVTHLQTAQLPRAAQPKEKQRYLQRLTSSLLPERRLLLIAQVSLPSWALRHPCSCGVAQCYWCQPAPALESAFTWQLLSFCKRNCSHRSLIFRLNMKKRWEVVWRERKESHETSKLFKGLPEFPPCISHPKHQRWWSSLPLGRVTTPLLFQ